MVFLVGAGQLKAVSNILTRRFGRTPQHFRLLDEVGHRPHAHFLHHGTPVKLDGNLTKIQFARHLLVHFAGGYQVENLNFSRRQLGILSAHR